MAANEAPSANLLSPPNLVGGNLAPVLNSLLALVPTSATTAHPPAADDSPRGRRDGALAGPIAIASRS